VPLANPGLLHKLVDPDAGDTLLVVTAPPPTTRNAPTCRRWSSVSCGSN